MSQSYIPIIYQARRKRGAGGGVTPQFLAEQLTLSQPGGADYVYHSTTSPPGFADLATALNCTRIIQFNLI